MFPRTSGVCISLLTQNLQYDCPSLSLFQSLKSPPSINRNDILYTSLNKLSIKLFSDVSNVYYNSRSKN